MAETEVPIDPQVEIVGVRSALMERAGRLAEMLSQPAEKRSETWGVEMKQARDEVGGLDARFTALERQIQPEAPVGQGPQAANSAIHGTVETRSMGQQFVESDEYRAWHGEGGRIPQGNVSSDVRTTVSSTATNDAGFTSGGSMLPIMPYMLNVNAIRRDRLYVRDLLPQTNTMFEIIHFVGETYVSGAGDAGMVAEAALKPEVAMNWYRQDQAVRKIAAWVPATLESLADVNQLRGAIDNRLEYKLRRKEEDQLINGDGTGQNLLGLQNFPNLQTASAGANALASFTKGMSAIENHDGDASGAIWNPTDYWAAMAASAATLTGASPFTGPPDTIWGIPSVRSPRQQAGHALLGDFKQAAELFDRESATVRVGDQHSDFFIRNQVAILIEERLALVCYRGDLFCDVTL
jgi:HK97 family phage major capsid protein